MKERNLAFVVIVSLVTLGIYSLYWLYSTRKEMIRKGHKIPLIWPAIVIPLLIYIGSIVLALTASGPGSTSDLLDIALILIPIGALALFIVLWVRLLSGYSRAVEKVTNGELTYGFNMAMAILHVIFSWTGLWIALVQYHFNRLNSAAPNLATTTPATSQPTAPPPPATPPVNPTNPPTTPAAS